MLRHNSQLAKTAAASACLFQSQAKKRLSVRELRQSLLEVIGKKRHAKQIGGRTLVTSPRGLVNQTQVMCAKSENKIRKYTIENSPGWKKIFGKKT
jgi:hypothetical protein